MYFQHSRMADGQHVRDLVKAANSAKAVFTEHSPDGVGQKRTREYVLEVNLVSQSRREKAVDAVNRWMKRDGDAPPEAVAVLQEDMGLDPEPLDELGIAFDEGAIVLGSEDVGASRRFTPTHVDEAFTYYVAGGQTSMVYYYDKVIPKARSLAASHQIALQLLSPKEVGECLDASISDHSSGAPDSASASDE